MCGPQYLYDALFEAAFFQVHQLLSIAGKRKENGRKGQRHPGELIYDVTHLRGIALKEVAAGGYVEEKVLHSEIAAAGAGHGLLPDDLAVLYLQADACLILFSFCF